MEIRSIRMGERVTCVIFYFTDKNYIVKTFTYNAEKVRNENEEDIEESLRTISSVGLEHLTFNQVVVGSNPL